MQHRTLIGTILTTALMLWGGMSPADTDEWSYDCQGWQPSSLQLRGPVTLSLSDDILTWSNGRKVYTAKFVDGSRTRKTYIDDASVFFVYGLWIRNSSVKDELKIVRVFYNRANVQSSELNCLES